MTCLRSSPGEDEAGQSTGVAGQSTVELALTLPVLVILVLAVVQVARVAGNHVALHHALREAARRAAVEPDPAAVGGVAARASPDLDPARLRVELGPQRGRGQLLPVTIVYRAPTEVPLVGRLIGDVELSATAVVAVE